MSNELNRRTFIAATGALAAGALTACGGGGAPLPFVATEEGPDAVVPQSDTPPEIIEMLDEARAADPILASLDRTDFEQWTGEQFEIRQEGRGTISVNLVDVQDRSHEMTDETRSMGLREPFTARFHGPVDASAIGGRYTVSHPAMGDVVLYVHQGGTTAQTMSPEGEPVDSGPVRNVYELYFD